jgi:hypothetical protein
LFIFLWLVSSGLAISECKSTVEPEDIPCQITSTWNYTPTCGDNTAQVYDIIGINIINYTYSNLNTTGLCFITWNVTKSGSYSGVVSNGDTFNITNGVENLQLATVIALAATAAIMLFLAFKLEKEHVLLQIGLVIFSMIMISMIPAALIIGTVNVIFHKAIMGFMVVFWIYLGVYLVYFILKRMEVIVPRK